MDEPINKPPVPVFGQIIGKKISLPAKIPSPVKRFCLFAFNRQAGYWKFESMSPTMKAALTEADKMHGHWSYFRIMEIDLP